MVTTILGVLSLLVGLLALALQRFYSCVPAKELKRLAARGDTLAAALYRPVTYGPSMRLFLWIMFGLGMAFGLLLGLRGLQSWAAFGVVMVSFAAVVWLQSVRLTVHSARLAVTVSPALHKALQYVHPPLSAIAKLLGHVRQHEPHSGLYEKSDLLALLQQQKEQLDNRISLAELELLERAARFDDVQAADVVLPWAKVKLVKTDDHLGPILLGELHNSGQSSFLVYDGTPENIIGTLFLRDAVHAKEGGLVSSVMHRKVCFVHEDFSLRQVLAAFTHTGQFMVVVINKFEEAVGVITLKHLLSQLVGETGQEDLAYENRAAVAAFLPRLQPVEEPIVDDAPSPSPDPQPNTNES